MSMQSNVRRKQPHDNTPLSVSKIRAFGQTVLNVSVVQRFCNAMAKFEAWNNRLKDTYKAYKYMNVKSCKYLLVHFIKIFCGTVFSKYFSFTGNSLWPWLGPNMYEDGWSPLQHCRKSKKLCSNILGWYYRSSRFQ